MPCKACSWAGPPLVLKSDNGSGFISDHTRKLPRTLAGLPPLLTAPYAGVQWSCRGRQGRAMKTRSEHQATLHGRSGEWTAADLAAAQGIANHLHRPWGYRGADARSSLAMPPADYGSRSDGLPPRRQQHRPQAADQLGFAKNHPLGRKAQARLDRLAIRRACVECGLLTFTQRSISPPITAHFDANIS